MRTAVFTLIFSIASFGMANTEIIESSNHGNTFIDTVNKRAQINYQTRLKNCDPKAFFDPKCTKGKDGKPQPAMFIVKAQNAKGVVVNALARFGKFTSCEEIQANPKAFFDANNQGKAEGDKLVGKVFGCMGKPAVTMTIDAPANNKNCELLSEGAARRIGTLDIDLSDEKIQNLINNCTADDKLLVIYDKTSGRGVPASIAAGKQCKLPRRHVNSNNAPWDENPLTQINTSDRNGFYVGDHTHWFFDEEKKSWCRHWLPDYGSTGEVCHKDFNNMTRAIAFAYPGEKLMKGVIQFKEENGKPVAYIGSPTQAEYSMTPAIDDSKPMMRISFEGESPKRQTVFENLPRKGGAASGRLAVQPTYTMGDQADVLSGCLQSRCLLAPNAVVGNQADANLRCQGNPNPVTLGRGPAACYSCNGITAGACTGDITLVTQDGKKPAHDQRNYRSASDLLGKIGQSCAVNATAPAPAPEPETEAGTVEQ